MIISTFLLLAAPFAVAGEPPALPGFPGSAVVVSTPAASSASPLLPPNIPARPKGTLDTASEVARDLAVRIEYFENGQSYYRAYTKGTHTPVENKAFVKFLEDYEDELGSAKRVHAILGGWLDKRSAIKD